MRNYRYYQQEEVLWKNTLLNAIQKNSSVMSVVNFNSLARSLLEK